MIISLNYFNNILLPKIKSKYTFLITFSLYSIALLVFIMIDNVIVNSSVFFFINFSIAFICYKSNITKSILSSLFLTAVMLCTEFLSMSILSIAHNGNINAYNSSIATYTIGVVFSKTLFLLFVKFSIILGFRLSERKKSKTPTFLFLFPFCSLIILYTFWAISSSYALSKEIELTISAASIALLLAIILSYVFYGKTSKELDELYKSQSETERINTDIAYYTILDKQNEVLKTFVHDEKNHLTVIKSLANNQNVDEYIDKVYGQIRYYSLFGNTKNKMLDLMINKYQCICENENIKFYVTIKTSNLSFIEQNDLISLLSNLLDNAVESAKSSTEKIIELSINKVNGFDILTCLNSCDSKPPVTGNGLKTTKTDTGLHGFGVRSIKKIANKYKGEFEWSYNETEKEFTVYIAFKKLNRINTVLPNNAHTEY